MGIAVELRNRGEHLPVPYGLAANKFFRHFVSAWVSCHVITCRAGDDQRGSRFVNQNGVHLVDDDVIEPALNLLIPLRLHVVTKIVESEFAVRSVGDVASVCVLADAFAPPGVELRLDIPYGNPYELEDGCSELPITFYEIIVDRDDVNFSTGEVIEKGREVADDGLAFSGLHFRDPALEEDATANQLAIEMPVLLGTPRSFTQ